MQGGDTCKCLFKGPPTVWSLYLPSTCYEPPFATGSQWSSQPTRAYTSCNTRVVPADAPDTWKDPKSGDTLVQLNSTQGNHSQPQCNTCLKSVFQCDRFKAIGDEQGYNQCRKAQSCFVFDAVRPDGRIIPLSMRTSAECAKMGYPGLRQCVTQCSTCQPRSTRWTNMSVYGN